MKTRLLNTWSIIRIFVLGMLFVPAFAQAQDAVGRVITTSGVVSAVDQTGNSRPLARGSEFFVNETVTTGADGTTQLRFSDASVITLNEESQFVVNAYQFDGAGGAADTAIMTMIQGSMRTISGAIGETTGDNYQMNTPYASIGIRGTDYAVRVTQNGRTFVIVFDGGVALTPSGGGPDVLLGLGGTSDVAEVEDGLTIVEYDDVPAGVQDLVDMIIQAITEAEVAALPAPEDAIEAQLQQEQGGQDQDDATLDAGDADAAGGALVDADGNALAVTTETDLDEAITTVIVTVSRVDPDLFAEETQESVSPH